MPGGLFIKGRFGVPGSIQDAFGFVYPGGVFVLVGTLGPLQLT